MDTFFSHRLFVLWNMIQNSIEIVANNTFFNFKKSDNLMNSRLALLKNNFISVNPILLILLITTNAFAQDREAMAKNPDLFLETAVKMLHWNEPAEPLKIVGNIYFVGTQGLNVWLITGSEGHILLNTGMPSSGNLIAASITKLGFKPQDIKMILTCHGHIDHVGGHAYMKKISGAKILAMENERDVIESGGKKDFHYSKAKSFYYDPVKVDQVVHNGDKIVLGDIEMTALLTPGHSKGATTWVMNVKEANQTYNVVFPDGTGINPGYHVESPQSYPKILDDYTRTLNVLEVLNPDIWLTPHAIAMNFDKKRQQFATDGFKVWIDREGYRNFIKGERKNLEDEIQRETEPISKK